MTFTPSALVQKLDGSVAASLAESFSSRFGACTGSPFTQGVIAGNGAACASVGICTSSSFSTYQFQLTGTDANGHSVTFDSPVLQFGARPDDPLEYSEVPSETVNYGSLVPSTGFPAFVTAFYWVSPGHVVRRRSQASKNCSIPVGVV